MNDIEYRLRDAYRGATDTVRPDAIRGLGERATMAAPSARWRRGGLHRLIVPLTAAAAVVVIGVVAGVVVPRALRDAGDNARNHGSGGVTSLTGDPATHFLVGLADNTANYLSVRSAITGAIVATLAPPRGWSFGPVATSDGRSYVAALGRGGHCGTWLTRFTISRTGRPSQLEPSRPGHVWSQAIEDLAPSRNGRIIALAGLACPRRGGNPGVGPGRPDLGVIKVKPTMNGYTSAATFWPLPGQSFVNSLSMTADGRQVEFSTDKSTRFASDIYLLPANAAPGGAEQRSRVIVNAARFGAPTAIGGSVMTPDGSTVYFTTYQTGRAFNGRWALRSVDVGSGRSGLLTEKPGFGVHIVASPSVRELIAFVQTTPPPPPSPNTTPPPTLSPVPTVPPSGNPSPVPTVTPSLSPSPAPSVSPSLSPSPFPSASPTSTPSATASLDAVLGSFDVITIQVPGGRIRYLNPVPWDVADFFYTW